MSTLFRNINTTFCIGLLVIVLCFGKINVYGQQYYFQNFNTENGLAQSQPLSFAQDKFNRIWIGTWGGGVSIFDGTAFTNYSRLDGLPDNSVVAIELMHDGSAWLGTMKGLSYFDGLKFSNFTIATQPDSNRIVAVKVDNRNRVWVQANAKLYQWIDGKFHIQNTPNDYVIKLFKDKAGVIHVNYAKAGILKYENDQWKPVLAADGALIIDATFDKNGKLYALSTKGILLKDGDTIKHITQSTPQLNLETFAAQIAIDASQNIWITSVKGVWQLKDGKFQHIASNNGFNDEATLCLFVDNYDNLWLGVNGAGIFKYAESPFTKFGNAILPNAKSISSLFRNGDKLTVGSLLLGIYDFDIKQYKVSKKHLNGMPELLTSIYQNNDFGLIVSSNNQLQQWKNNTKTIIQNPRNIAAAIWLQVADTIWGVANNNLCKIHKDTLEYITQGKNIVDLQKTHNDNLLIGSPNGVLLFNRATRQIEIIDSLKGIRVHSMATDAQRWYIGTDDRGLIIYNIQNKTIEIVDQKRGLSCNFIYNILIDQLGNIWTGTGCGIDKIAIDNSGQIVIKSYGKSDGLDGAESNAHASYQDKEGNIWFGTTKGLYCYNSNQEKTEIKTPFVMLQSIELFSNSIDGLQFSDSLIPYSRLPYLPVFKHDHNSLTFSYKAICLSAPEKIQYRYQLLGADKAFVTTRLTTVSYNQLSPGNYTFVVFASDENGNWHDNATRYSFTIKAIFYQTVWFKTLLSLLFATTLGYFVWSFIRRKAAQRQRELKLREEEQAKVRQRTAEDFHDEIGNKITRINLLTMMAEKRAGSGNVEALMPILQQIRQNTQSLYYGSKDIIWALQKESNYLKEALLRIQQNTIALLNETEIQLQIEEEPAIKNDILMPMDYGRNLILIFKEAVNNAMKYSEASKLILRFYEDIDNSIVLELEDNGKGFDMEDVVKGNGLANMERRALSIKAKYSIHSLNGIGTLVRLRMFNYSFKA